MNIAICDIDKEFASIIKLKIEEKLGSVDVDIYTDSKLLMQSDKVYDCVFLYMDMPDINGIDMARCIREKYTFTKMIFILSKLDAVVEVMKYNPYRFIRKEHLEEDIKEVIAVLKEKSEEKQLFYIWGHSYEFEADGNWDVIEKFAELTGGKDSIWYANNLEIYDYIADFKRLYCSVDGSRMHNPTNRTLWFLYNSKIVSIAPGETISL